MRSKIFEEALERFTGDWERPARKPIGYEKKKIVDNPIINNMVSTETYPVYEFSEEVYFGQRHPFPTEMIAAVTKMREELRILLDMDWADENKRTAIIQKAVNSSKKDLIPFVDALGEMERIIAKYCNIEKCYIGLEPFTSLVPNAHTCPMSWDSSTIFNSAEGVLTRTSDGRLRLDPEKLRSDADIEKRLMTLEDICLNKDGWKFKEKDGKIFIIGLSIPLLVDDNFGASVMNITGVLFHEIGHNFQQILRGCNQDIIDTMISCLVNKCYHVYDGASDFQNAVLALAKATETDPKLRFAMIRDAMIGEATIYKDGTVETRDEYGKYEKGKTLNAILTAKAYHHGVERKRSWLSKVIGGLGKAIKKTIELVFAPLTLARRTAKRNKFHEPFAKLIKENKQYEQFADAFAVSYGFDVASYRLMVDKLYDKLVNESGRFQQAPRFLNKIPFLSECLILEKIRETRFVEEIDGHDTSRARIANAYKALQYELQNNPDLSSDQKKEILLNIERAKTSFDEIKRLEVEFFRSSPSITKKIMAKVNSETIDEVADANGLTEMVLEVVNEYEKTGKINDPAVMAKFKEINDISRPGKKKFADRVNRFFDFVKTKLGFDSKKLDIDDVEDEE